MYSSNNIQMPNWSCAYMLITITSIPHIPPSRQCVFMLRLFTSSPCLKTQLVSSLAHDTCENLLYSYESVAYFLLVFYDIFLSAWILDFNESCILMKTSCLDLDLDFWASLLVKQCHGWLTLFTTFDCLLKIWGMSNLVSQFAWHLQSHCMDFEALHQLICK